MDDVYNCPANAQSLTDMVKSLLIREGDIHGINFLQYYEMAKDVYRELNLYSIRWSKRYMIEVDPKTNSILLPKDCLLLTSISVIDDCNQIVPLVLNPNITGELIDINLDKDCKCQCNCQSQLCGTLKHYEVIYKTISAPLPDGTTGQFECYSRKTIYPNGNYFLEYNEPVVEYEDGIHIATTLVDRSEFICKLQVKDCGCVDDTPQNRDLICGCCGPSYLTTECGTPCCPTVNPDQAYGYQQLSYRVNFDSNFSYKYVLVRYLGETKGKDLMIPLVAKTALIRGIAWEKSTFETGTGYTALAIQRRQIQFERLYKDAKKDLFRLLNRFSLAQFYSSIIPARYIP